MFLHKRALLETMKNPLVSLHNISKQYRIGNSLVKAVENFSLDIFKGEVVGLAGESGCGKTTIGKVIARLIEPTSGSLLFEDQNLLEISSSNMRSVRRRIQIVLQDPYGSLNPRLTIKEIVEEGLKIHGIDPKNTAEETLEAVGLTRSLLNRYPATLSGGQRQRVSIARALALKPNFIVFDESVSALDITHQRQIIKLLQKLREERDLTYLFISHDLSILKALSDRIGVMHKGKLVELGEVEDILTAPQNPYSQALISAIPIPDPIKEKFRVAKTT